jgi:hypothetical protein
MLVLISSSLGALDLFLDQVIELIPGQVQYRLDQTNLVVNSESVVADSTALIRNIDYTLDHRAGMITLRVKPTARYLKVTALLVPPDLANDRFLYEPRVISDTLFASIKPRRTGWFEPSGDLSVSGSKTFAITFSNEDAFDLKQSLFVNLSGELGKNVNISAQLSDSQSELSPEGDSKELSSLDQVFIRVFGRHYEIAMGDLELKFSGTRYIDYFSKFEGISARVGKDSFVQLAWSAGGGKRAELDISIIDGKQGPYYLNPLEYQTGVLIVAGSESIYRDGIPLERGTDYFIDYSEGSVMFRTLVTSSNLVHAYFQYSDEYYTQSTLLNSSGVKTAGGFSLSHHIIHQTDAKDNPLLFDLTDADRDSLAMAGDSPAWGEGAFQVETGAGSYIRLTTPSGIVYYQYAESDSLADYSVYFTYVGTGNGDYEQYSSGKYRYLGPGLGDWLPVKRLIAPTMATNAGLRATYESGAWKIGVEGLYSARDQNTLSGLNDADNSGGIVSVFAAFQPPESSLAPRLEAIWEKRWADTYLFSTYSDPAADHDLAGLPVPDSLALDQFDLSASIKAGKVWTPRLAFRVKSVPGFYAQRALRWTSVSSQMGLLPQLNFQNTVSLQDPLDGSGDSSVLQFHNIRTAWDHAGFKAGAAMNLNSLEYLDTEGPAPGYRKSAVNPFLGFTLIRGSNTAVSATFEAQDKQDDGWLRDNSSQTYTLKHITSSENHNISLDLSHRDVVSASAEGTKSYDLINFRTNNAFLKRALVLNGNYQLNQSEFFPKIRELQYIGDGLGIYDSTGVYLSGGDWDYVYITSGAGSLSTEVNGQLSFYLKPGNYFKGDLFRRVNSDLLISASEQTAQTDDWRSYIFWPGYVYDEDSSIYARQNYLQNIWLELARNKATARLQFEIDRSLDNRYQERGRTYKSLRMIELQLQRLRSFNITLAWESSRTTDTRYQSDLSLSTLNCSFQKPVSATGTLRVDIGSGAEHGKSQISSQIYDLATYYLKPLWRSTWGRKGRLTAGLTFQYNKRRGDELLTFLPEKREGFIGGLNLSVIYRLNNFSSASLDYTGSSYPDEKMKHQLKLEFRAEL